MIERCTPVWTISPGAFERRRDVRRAAEHVPLADHRRDLVDAVDAVLQRQHRRVPAPISGFSIGSAVALS